MFFPSSSSWVCLPALGLGGREVSELPLAQAGGGTAGTRPAEAVSVVPAA